EYVAGVAETLRGAGALDVVLTPTIMKKGRPGVRIEVLAHPALADSLETLLFSESSSLGVRRVWVERRSLARVVRTVRVREHEVRVKVAELGNGVRRAKPEYEDVAKVAAATGGPLRDLYREALREAERLV
ncbi:MAG: nickel insertion protein, partial [Gemmatimonadaceae bacterium]